MAAASASSPFQERMVIPPEMLSARANTFTYATLCSIVGLNPKCRQLTKDHLKTVRREIWLKFHPDKSALENAKDYFMFYKDCLDCVETKLESFTTDTKEIPQQPQQRRPHPPSPSNRTSTSTSRTTTTKKPMFTNSRFQNARFNDQEFETFIERARQEELQKNKHVYQYETQEQSTSRFATDAPHAPRSAEEVNRYFSQLHQDRMDRYQQEKTTTSKLAEEHERFFAAYNEGLDTSSSAGISASSSSSSSTSTATSNKGKFTNERFEEMLRNVSGAAAGGGGGGATEPPRIKTVSLLSSAQSGKLDFAQTFFQQEEDDQSVTFRNSRVSGMNVWDAHDPRKHLVSSKTIHGNFTARTNASDYERARKEDIFQFATSREEQDAMLREKELKRQQLHRERLMRTYGHDTK